MAMAVGFDDNVICITNQQQMFNVFLQSQDSKGDVAACEHFITPFHGPGALGYAAITGISFALWRPLVATCGRDGTVRLWNFQERKQELCKEIEADPLDIAMHPSGLSVMVAFVDKIRVYSILLGKLHETRELGVRQCNMIRFSRGGQMVAAASGSSIIIFDTNTGTQLTALRGHQVRPTLPNLNITP